MCWLVHSFAHKQTALRLPTQNNIAFMGNLLNSMNSELVPTAAWRKESHACVRLLLSAALSCNKNTYNPSGPKTGRAPLTAARGRNLKSFRSGAQARSTPPTEAPNQQLGLSSCIVAAEGAARRSSWNSRGTCPSSCGTCPPSSCPTPPCSRVSDSRASLLTKSRRRPSLSRPS